MITACRIARLHAVMLPSIRRHDAQTTRLVMTVYVRNSHGRTVTIELAPANTVWWATERALISLGDQRQANDCRLVLRAKPLRPRRSLAASGIHHGDTLNLVPANAIRRRTLLPRTLNMRSLQRAPETNRRKHEPNGQR
jgi:hypothetical protein